jgi:predicted transcriptional regulator of viral defense system
MLGDMGNQDSDTLEHKYISIFATYKMIAWMSELELHSLSNITPSQCITEEIYNKMHYTEWNT